MHQRPGVNWKVEDLAREAGLFTLAVRGTFSRRHRHHSRPLSPPSCVCGWRCSTSPMKARRWKKSPSASGISRWRPSAGLQTHHSGQPPEPCAPRHARVSLYVKAIHAVADTKALPLKRRAGDAEHPVRSAGWQPPSRKINCWPPTSSPCSPGGGKPSSASPAIAHRLRIDHLEHRLLERNVAQRMRASSLWARSRASAGWRRLLPTAAQRDRPARQCRHRW